MTLKAIDGPTIGLLAGMGVKSTAPFLDLIIDECRRQYGAAQQDEYPQMVVFSWPIPFRVGEAIDEQALGARIAAGVRRLSATGVDFIAIPANMPHMFWEQLKAAAAVPLLNMIEITAESIPPHSEAVALLAVRPTRDSGLYHRPLAKRGIRVVATDRMQDQIDAILQALWRGDDGAGIRQRWDALIRLARDEGATRGLIACTDLNAIENIARSELPLLDATRALAERVVSTWLTMASAAT